MSVTIYEHRNPFISDSQRFVDCMNQVGYEDSASICKLIKDLRDMSEKFTFKEIMLFSVEVCDSDVIFYFMPCFYHSNGVLQKVNTMITPTLKCFFDRSDLEFYKIYGLEKIVMDGV